jgi:hypothetical protein
VLVSNPIFVYFGDCIFFEEKAPALTERSRGWQGLEHTANFPGYSHHLIQYHIVIYWSIVVNTYFFGKNFDLQDFS